MPKSSPIIFSGPMVRAIIEGRKTQTRRVVKVQPPHMACEWPDGQPELTRWFQADEDGDVIDGPELRCPYGGPGDQLWVRETFVEGGREPCDCLPSACLCRPSIEYRADWAGIGEDVRWISQILMPRWASRITLEVVSARIERLQAISEADARAEGVPTGRGCVAPVKAYENGWNSINGKRAPWSSNPWVWVIEFRKVEQAAAQRGAEQ